MAKAKRSGASRVSRNKKAYWRRGVDTAGTEDGLAHHAYLQSLIVPDALSIDRSPAPLVDPLAKPPPKRRLKGAALQAALSREEHLRPNSAVRAAKVAAHHRPGRWGKAGQKEKAPAKAKGVKKEESEADKPKHNLAKIRFQAITAGKVKRTYAESAALQPSKFNEVEEATANLWAAPPPDGAEEAEGLDERCADHFLRQTKRRQPRKPKTPLPVSAAAKVKPSAPGASYNPTFDDHQDLLADLARKEMRREAAVAKVEASLRPRLEPIVTEAEREAELRQGLCLPGDEPEDSDDPDDQVCRALADAEEELGGFEESGEEESFEAGTEGAKATEVRRKSKAKRRALARSKALQEAKAERKAAKSLDTELFRTKNITKELKKGESEQAKRLAKRAEGKAHDKLHKRRRLSRHGTAEAAEAYQLGEELGGSLRLVKPAGSVLADRAASLQKRNLVPVHTRQKRLRTYKRKRVETREHRQVDMDYLPK